jgi:TRAP-type C4-dicarboxylate transport system permease small subunit
MLEFLIGILGRFLQLLSATAMILLSLLIVVDVTLRYIFSAPIFGSDEMSTYLFGVIVIAGLGLVTQERAHIVVNLFEDWLKVHAPTMTRILFDVTNLFGMAFVAFVLARHSFHLMAVQQQSMVLKLPIGAIAVCMSCMAFIGILLGIATLVRPRASSESGL